MKGTCPLCAATYYGWALANPEEHKCSRCDGALEIERDGVLVRPDVSPLKGAEY